VDAGNLLQSLATATVWQSRRLDPTGFYWMGARYYDPQSGRFLSPDPLGHDASLSLYDYANGDPVNGLDPDGRCVKGLFGGAIKGDYYKPENTAQAVGQFLGQVGVGFTPAGIFADIRDLSAAYGDIQKDGLSWGSGTNLALGAVAVIPGVGDVVKGAGKAILRTFTKNAQEIRAIDRAAVLSDAPTVNLSEFGNAAETTGAIDVAALDFSTGANKAVFYSGPGNRARALTFADNTGTMPIDLTPGGKYLNSLKLYDTLPAAEADAIWSLASKQYAAGASGKINLFINGARPDRVFHTIERPLIEANPTIYKQTFHY
jgi:RHS repeat-associated protein